MTDLKLVIEDTIDNVATLQDCSGDHSQSVQLLGENTQLEQEEHKSSFHLVLKEPLYNLLFSISDFQQVPQAGGWCRIRSPCWS